MLFDQEYYLSINQARWQVVSEILQQLSNQPEFSLATCLDVGCGPGWFAAKLVELGLQVQGIDGREELITAAQSRVKNAQFLQVDAESKTAMSKCQTSDLVLCLGLIYHTENPFRVVRNVAALTQKVLLVESIIIPNSEPITWLIEEGKNETQGLTHYAMLPSRNCLLKMLQVSGIPHIYEYTGTINHIDFLETPSKHRRRQLFMATTMPVNLDNFQEVPEIQTPKYTKDKFNKNST